MENISESSEDKKRGRGRPTGSVTKKYSVLLKDLNRLFKEDAPITITKEMAQLIKQMDSSTNINETTPSELGAKPSKNKPEEVIGFTVEGL